KPREDSVKDLSTIFCAFPGPIKTPAADQYSEDSRSEKCSPIHSQNVAGFQGNFKLFCKGSGNHPRRKQTVTGHRTLVIL
ncbi:MAG: hypothetical protein P8130_02475, partial [Deltaproteobacteria bacterium]